MPCAFFAFELVVNLDGRLPQQEQAAADEDEIAAREAVIERGEERLGEPHDPGEREEQQDAHAHRAAEAERPRALLLFFRQLADEDGDENDVVYAENDFEKREGEKARSARRL